MAKKSVAFSILKRKTRADAERAGRPHYYTGKVCVNGHRCQRRTCNGNCLLCEAATGSRRAAESNKKFKTNNPSKHLIRLAAHRASIGGYQCTITPEDIGWPEKCPCCQKVFPEWTGTGTRDPNCRSIDKVIPEKGYVPGNSIIICLRCNTIKSNASAAELRQIADWMDALTGRVSSP